MDSQAEASPALELAEEALHYCQPDGATRTVRWNDLRAVLIETTDQGPFVEDVWWILIDSAGHCMIPQLAGTEALLARLQALPNFDNDAVIAAMASVENLIFVCWQRK